MAGLPYLDAETIRSAVPIRDMIEAVSTAYRAVAAGKDHSPLRSHLELPAGGSLLLMPGLWTDATGSSVKIVTVMPGNAELGLPTIHAVVLWIDTRTGRPLAALDGALVTAMRTGAATGAATRLLARSDADVLAMIGTGGQAEWQVRAVCDVRPIREVRVFSRRPEPRAAFAARIAHALPEVSVTAAESAEAAVRGASVIACATTASAPVLEAGWVDLGAHVSGVGAYRPDMVELPPELFARADLVAVDNRRAALAEGGDLLAALGEGRVAKADLVEIGGVPEDYAERRPPRAITVFKSVGLAIQDVAATQLIASRLLDRA